LLKKSVCNADKIYVVIALWKKQKPW